MIRPFDALFPRRPLPTFSLTFVRLFRFDAIVSGYKYHKSGRECWLTPWGDVRKGRSRDSPPSQDQLLLEALLPLSGIQSPPRNGRSICRYLQEVSEVDGLRVYAEYSVRFFYVTLINLYKVIQLLETQYDSTNMIGQTIFVCFEDFTSPDPVHKAFTIQTVLNFLYPGGQRQGMVHVQDFEFGEYKGGHASEKDPHEMERLLAIVKQLDHELFGNALSNLNAMFGDCASRKS